ncbi:hypothetical protein ACIBCS_11415 [Streptomyces phaeochromogenes]|uniref:hypothetical protein n=1 Tax=Streptomyces phaeochromogenes TaxID=1923 RepID=UPI003408CC0E
MSLVREQADLPVAPADAAGEEDDSVLVEDYLAGVPLTVGLLELPGGAVVVLPRWRPKPHRGRPAVRAGGRQHARHVP